MSEILSRLNYYPPLSWWLIYRTYRHWYQFLNQSEKWDKKKIEAYQLQELNKILNHVNRHVPYYQQFFKKNQLKNLHLTSLSDLKKIPILTKNLIRNHQKDFKSTYYPSTAFQKTCTGGTTGEPLSFYIEKARWLGKHFAFNRKYMEQAGYHPSHKVMSFSGKTKKIHHYPLLRTLELSSLHMSQDDLAAYIQKTISYKPDFINSYPSALLLFTRYLRRKNKNLPKIKGIFLHGETLFDWQRTLFKETYNCPVLDQYGHREQAVFATTCNESNLYHVYPQYGILEIINNDDIPIKKSKKHGAIIATSLHKRLFPFIRYNTEDIGEITSESCPCGRSYPLLKTIRGRTQDYLVTKHNDIIPLTGTYHLIAESSSQITECQLYQENEGDLIIYLVKADTCTDRDIRNLKAVLDEKIGSLFEISINLIDHIPRTKHGKYQYLIQKIPIKTKNQ